MPSKTDILNRSLRLIKADRVASIDDGDKNANVARDVYDLVRDELLRGHKWNFNKELVKLSRSATTPAYKWDFGYVLPSDWIRTYSVSDNDGGFGTVLYEEGKLADQNVLFASVESLFLTYGQALVDPNLMPEDFHAAQSYELALAMPGISNASAADTEQLVKDASQKLRRAKSTDALGQPMPQRPRGSWANSRGGWRQRWPATG